MIIKKINYRKSNFIVSFLKYLVFISWEMLYDLLLFRVKAEPLNSYQPYLLVEKDSCQSCTLCQQLCPDQAINRVEDILYLDLARCSSCEYCISVCPTEQLVLRKRSPLTLTPAMRVVGLRDQ